MLQALVIVLREGFETFLIVAVIVAYLQRTGRRHLLPAVGWGILVALLISGALGLLLAQWGMNPLWEGILGLVAVVLVSTLVLQMWTHAKYLKKETEQRLRPSLRAPCSGGWRSGCSLSPS